MTEHNLFQEIQEDLERQRLETLWKNYGVWVIILALALVLATAGLTAYRSWQTDYHQKVTMALIQAAQSHRDPAGNLDALRDFAQNFPKSELASLARLDAANLALEQNDKAMAIKLYGAVADDVHADDALRQLGLLLATQLQIDSGDAKQLIDKLQPLTVEHAPWRFAAMETQGFLALKSGDAAKAKSLFTELSQAAGAPATMAARAAVMARYLREADK